MTTDQRPSIGIRPLVAAVGQGPTNGRYLTRDEAREAMAAILDGTATRAQAGGLLLLQRYRGEAPEELLGYCDAIRARSTLLQTNAQGLLDIGSPYDGRSKHAVISPAASIVAAAAGVPVVMHGERDMGPKKGIAVGDVIEALGVDTDAEPAVVERGIEACGIGYLRQARANPALYALKSFREELGLRTPIHMIEKLHDPANAPFHLIGVAHMPYMKQLGPALAALPFRRTMIVQGVEGHEDVPTTRGSRVIEVAGDTQDEWRLDPEALGLTPATDDDLAPGDAERSARMTLDVLSGSGTPGGIDLVVLNAALRIKLTGAAASLADALGASRDALTSGAAMRKLEAWREVR